MEACNIATSLVCLQTVLFPEMSHAETRTNMLYELHNHHLLVQSLGLKRISSCCENSGCEIYDFNEKVSSRHTVFDMPYNLSVPTKRRKALTPKDINHKTNNTQDI